MHMPYLNTLLRRLAALGVLLFAALLAAPAQAQEAYIAEVRLFAGNFAPRGWALAQGQLLSIAQNTALFSIIGTTYGGDGRTTFALPDLRGRVAVGVGQGPGLQSYSEGEMAGSETVTLNNTQMPMHTHSLNASTAAATTSQPGSGVGLAASQNAGVYGPVSTITPLSPVSIGIAGSSAPVSIVQPFLAMNYIICMQGIFPSRP